MRMTRRRIAAAVMVSLLVSALIAVLFVTFAIYQFEQNMNDLARITPYLPIETCMPSERNTQACFLKETEMFSR